MQLKNNLFVFMGLQQSQRQQAMGALQQRLVQKNQASISRQIFYGKELTLQALQEALGENTLDTLEIILIKDALKISKKIKDFLQQTIAQQLRSKYLFIELAINPGQLGYDRKLKNDAWIQWLIKQATVYRLAGRTRTVSLDDFTRCLWRNQFPQALDIMEQLLLAGHSDRELGPLTIGILNQSLTHNFDVGRRNYAQYLWQADQALKEKGVSPHLVLTMLFVRLMQPEQHQQV